MEREAGQGEAQASSCGLDLVTALYRRWASTPQALSGDSALTWAAPEETSSSSLTHPDAEICLSYAELQREIKLSAGLVTSLGLKRGEVLGLQAPRSIDWLPLFLGALSQGVTILLLNDAYTPRELDFFLSDACARLALIPERAHQPLEALQALRPPDERTALLSPEVIRERRSRRRPLESVADLTGDDLAVLAYTSGTTGQPKGAQIRHRDLMGTLRALHEAWAWSAEDVLIHTLPLFHIHGLFVAALGCLWARAHLVLLPKFNALNALRAVAAYDATVLMGVPTHHHRYLKIPADLRPDVSHLRLVTSGSAPLSAERFEAFREAFGVEIVERYGMTEVGIVLSAPLSGVKKPGSVGYPLPGVLARICDDQGKEVARGETGELHISSQSLFAGYYGRPKDTSQSVYRDTHGRRWMRTGDLCSQDDDGMYWLRGRASEMIISGGLNVYPKEVERAIFEVGSGWIDEVVVLGVADPEWGERVEAYLTTPDQTAPASHLIQDLTTQLSERLAPYKRPKQIRWISTLPRNAMGKLQRHRLRPSWRPGGCHCGAVRWRVYLPERFDAEDCNCSICAMSGNVHVIVKAEHFELIRGSERLRRYRFNTQQAEHLFCEECGVKSFYHPRSHPHGIGVTWRCIDDWTRLEVNAIPFDGQNWEASIDQLRHRSS